MVLLILMAISIILITEVVSVASDSSLVLTSFCTGLSHSCAVFNSSLVKCVGQEILFGNSTSEDDGIGKMKSELGENLPFINIGSFVSIDDVKCGGSQVCFRLNDGKIKCIGSNVDGIGGIGVTADPIGAVTGYIGDNLPFISLGAGLKVLDMAIGITHTCAKLTGNKLKCFGRNGFGQLGQGTYDPIGASIDQMGDNLPVIDLGVDVEVASIHSGTQAYHNCAILSSPEAAAQRFKCWGYNSNNQLGYGDTSSRGDETGEMGGNLPLVDLGIESKVKQLALGYKHGCGLLISNKLKCWGHGYEGQLGLGSRDSVTVTGDTIPFVTFDSERVIKYITAGGLHTCLSYDDQITMKCFGDNLIGELGQGDTGTRGAAPTTLIPSIPAINFGTGSLKISTIHTGQYFNCAVFVDSTVRCFGDNRYGQIGVGLSGNIGDGINEMGRYLRKTMFLTTTFTTDAPTQLPTQAPVTPPCSFAKEKLCKKDSKCIWRVVKKKGACSVFSCDLFTNSADCSADVRCFWSKIEKNGKCITLDCTMFPTKKLCKSYKQCFWIGDACVLKPF